MVFTVPIELLMLNSSTTLSLLERCSSMEDLKQIHARILKTGLSSDSLLTTKLLAVSASPATGNLAYAKAVFHRIPNPDTFTWNTMIMGLSNGNEPQEAILLYIQMLKSSNMAHKLHNSYTFPFLLKAMARTPDALAETKQIHGRVLKLGFGSEVFTSNSLIRAYGVFGDVGSARLVFDCLPEKDVVSWNSMIDGLGKNGEVGLAFELFSEMADEVKNVVSWTTMVKCCVGAGLNKEALDLFYEMQGIGVKPDKAALSSALTACAKLGALDHGVWIHAYMKKKGVEIDSISGCVLIDMYAKCGDLESAIEVFLEVKGTNNVEIWTAMIMGYGIHGRGKEALKLFREMENKGLQPNGITFTAVLTACSCSGLVDEGRMVFGRMEGVYGIRASMEHYGCMVDLLGRAGLLDEAKEVIGSMPWEPNAVVLGSMLNACRVHGNLELGKEVGEVLVQVDPSHGGRHVHLASVYSANGEWNEAVNVRRKMKNQGVSKVRGFSAIAGPDGDFREFSAVSEPDAQTRETYNCNLP